MKLDIKKHFHVKLDVKMFFIWSNHMSRMLVVYYEINLHKYAVDRQKPVKDTLKIYSLCI